MTFGASLARPALMVAAVFVAALAVTGLVRDSYWQLMLTLVPIWAVMGLAWNVLGGYAGLVSFGHAAFFGLGAYTVALAFEAFGLSPWLGWPLAGLVGALSGLLVGAITFRLKGHYFSLAMLAYPLALLHVFDWAGLTELSLPMRRDDGALYMQFQDPRILTAIAMAMMALALLTCLAIERSRFGLALVAIRQNELAARAAGIPVRRWKLVAIAVSGGLAGLAGGLYAVVLLIVTPPSAFGMLVSAQALIVTMFGGIGSAWGPLIGAVVLVPLSELLHAQLGTMLPGIQGVVFGLAIIVIVLFKPQGLYWALQDRFGRRAEAEPAQGDGAAIAAAPVHHLAVAAGRPLLVVEALNVRFGGLSALSDVSLSVDAGEILGIIGPNGAGKTTLFNAINGIVVPASGAVRFDGHSLAGCTPEQVCAAGIGRTFQTVRAFPRLSLMENVVTGAFVAHRRNDEALAAARAALGRVGLAERAHVMAGALTNGELRLMELARALAGNPRLILMDESFAGLSSADIDGMIPLIRQLRDEGVTIVIIEHTMQAMVRLADRFVVLDHGSVIASGNPEAVIRDRSVVAAYLGKRWADHAAA
jgi:ABC-type branched-subunit amino acid transport system ATPase component/ABC-type branched-subunit amino acid transport system permease subunit